MAFYGAEDTSLDGVTSMLSNLIQLLQNLLQPVPVRVPVVVRVNNNNNNDRNRKRSLRSDRYR